MNFRYARHTSDLTKLTEFYTHIAGLERLGGFTDHAGYKGVFLGYPGKDWHLEFTESEDQPVHSFDPDDILVFYLNTELELDSLRKDLATRKIPLLIPQNPYWKENGIMIADPDGHRIIFSLMHIEFNVVNEISVLLRERNISHWSGLVEYVRHLPYGRNQNREDLFLVLKENKGTCSSKHALLKKMADIYRVPGVKLVMGLYKMNGMNTPGIGNVIPDNGLRYIPEAHCYLKINGKRFDITTHSSSIERLQDDILLEVEIQPEQVNVFKVDFHKNYIRSWIVDEGIEMDVERVWNIREECIRNLEIGRTSG